MELIVQGDEGVHVEHLLLGGRRPEVEHHHLGIRLGEFPGRAIGRRKVDVEVSHLPGLVQRMADFHGVGAAGRFLLQRLHIAGVRIDRPQGIADAAEEDAVRRLVEHGQVLVDPLEKDRDSGQGLGVLQHIAGAAAVVVHIAAAEFGIGIRGLAGGEAVHVHEELCVFVLHPLQKEGFFGAFHRIVAEGIGNDLHAVALAHQERGYFPVPVEQIDEFRVLGRKLQLIGESAGSIRLHRVQHLVLIDIQELHDDGSIGLARQGSVDDGFGAAGGQEKGRSGGDQDSNGFHTRQGWRQRCFSSPPGPIPAWPCGNPGPPRSGGEPDGYACEALPFRGRRRPPAGTGRPS